MYYGIGCTVISFKLFFKAGGLIDKVTALFTHIAFPYMKKKLTFFMYKQGKIKAKLRKNSSEAYIIF